MKKTIINPKSVSAGIPKNLTARMPARSSAPVAHSGIQHAAGPGPVRRVPFKTKVAGLAG